MVLAVAFAKSPGPTEMAIPLACGFGLICEILACVLGRVGKQHLPGKIGMIGGATTLVLVVALVVATIGLYILSEGNAAKEHDATIRDAQNKKGVESAAKATQ